MDHLRDHPNVEPLPLANTIPSLSTLEDVRWFRQDSWQWDAVHQGRCTTSQAVAALGFLEPKAGTQLNIPRSWQRGGGGAFFRLSQPALRTLSELNSVLCSEYNENDDEQSTDNDTVKQATKRWIQPKRAFPFAAKYTVTISEADTQQKRERATKYSNSSRFDSSVRMMWGNAQEATALLTALNYFWKHDKEVILKEVGMCGAGLELNATSTTHGLLVGASPDGLLCYPDGRVEVLEVKNHCPFFTQSKRQPRNKRFFTRNFVFDNHNHLLPPHYIPQLMMEMLCVGTDCQSAIMVRQTATSGALIIRVHRDNAWIQEMLYWLQCFHDEFVEPQLIPPEDFFFSNPRYQQFLNQTQQLESNRVEVVARIPHSEIQRAMSEDKSKGCSLFLD